MKWFNNEKATSSTALVSVLVIGVLIFSFAVAVSSGALTLAFIAYEHVSLTNFTWGPNNAYCQVTVENTGTADLSILAVRINGVAPKSVDPSLMVPYALDKGASVVFTLTMSGFFTRGSSYEFEVITTKGNSFSCCVTA